MKKIISLIYIKNNKPRTTKAKFVCSLTFQLSQNKKITRQGVIYGNISNSIKGKNGFGYDSIFIPKNYKLTFGQMNKRKKMIIDHRYLAFKKLKKKINIL